MDEHSSDPPVSFKVSVVDLAGVQQEKRRFSIDRDSATKFWALKGKLKTYFPQLETGQSIKVVYKGNFIKYNIWTWINLNLVHNLITDSEGDDITISTDEELKCAIDQSDGVCKFQVAVVKDVGKPKPIGKLIS